MGEPLGSRRGERYRAYILSDAWRAKADACKAAARWSCQRCGRDGPLEAHHLHYRTLGYERPQDVMALCPNCHRVVHGRPLDLRGLDPARMNLDEFAAWCDRQLNS